MSSNYPSNVQKDLDAGFRITDEDDGFQRVKKLSDTVFQYKCDYNDSCVDETIDVEKIDKVEAISGGYSSIEEVYTDYGDDANMIFAECEFELRCPPR